MKKLIPLFVVLAAGIASAEWKLNPYTQRQDYYEAAGNSITSLTGAVTASGPGAAAATIVSVPQSAVNLSTVTTALSGKLDTNGSAASLTNFPTLNQNTTGNAATATALAADPSDCTGVNFARGIAAGGAAACAQPSDVTGNAATATKLATARTINGVSFDGSADINISATSYLADGVSLALTGATFSAKSSSVTLQGNTFNGASQLVKLDALSKLPAVDGSQLTNLPSTSGGAVLAATQTFTGANTFTDSVTVSSFTATNALVSTATIGTEAIFAAASAPAGVPGKGVLYYDNALNVFMVKENGGVAKPIVDPPGNWTCTIRSASACSSIGTTAQGATIPAISCEGTEKMLSYSVAVEVPNVNSMLYSGPTCTVGATGFFTGYSGMNPVISGQGIGSSYTYGISSVAPRYIKITSYINCCL